MPRDFQPTGDLATDLRTGVWQNCPYRWFDGDMEVEPPTRFCRFHPNGAVEHYALEDGEFDEWLPDHYQVKDADTLWIGEEKYSLLDSGETLTFSLRPGIEREFRPVVCPDIPAPRSDIEPPPTPRDAGEQ